MENMVANGSLILEEQRATRSQAKIRNHQSPPRSCSNPTHCCNTSTF